MSTYIATDMSASLLVVRIDAVLNFLQYGVFGRQTGHQGAGEDFGKGEIERVDVEVVRRGGCYNGVRRICVGRRRCGGILMSSLICQSHFEGKCLANVVQRFIV